MTYPAILFFACILVGFGLYNVPTTGILAGLGTFLDTVGLLVILIFSIALLYIGFKTLFSRSWR